MRDDAVDDIIAAELAAARGQRLAATSPLATRTLQLRGATAPHLNVAARSINPPELLWRRDPAAWLRDRAHAHAWSKQREIIQALVDHPKVAVHSSHGIGKGLALDTPLPTPTGWTTMADVRVGDTLFDETGAPCTVTAVSEINRLDCYRITFTSGASIVCDGDHQWSTIDMSTRAKISGRSAADFDWRNQWNATTVRTGREIAAHTSTAKSGFKLGVPMSRALQTTEDHDLLVPPYILGVWLGDGTHVNACVTNDPNDDEIIQRVRAHGWLTFRSAKNPISVRLRPSENQAMAPLLRALGVFGNKHIPQAYLRASYTQRLELLRGLMDTDGHAPKNGQTCGVGFKSEILARGTYELVRSLGWKASLRTKRAKLHGKDCGDFYMIHFSATESPFNLTRKTARWIKSGSQPTMHTVRSVERVPTVPTRCITVNSPRALYLAGRDMIVTHNSYIASRAVGWWLDVHPDGEAFAVTTAPTDAQVKAILWREINKMHASADLRGRTNLSEWYMGNELVALGRKPSDHSPTAFQGIHARFVLTVLDEACGVPKDLWDAASTLGTNEYSRMLAIGNPDDPHSEFAKICQPGSGWYVIHVSTLDTPNFTGEEVPRSVAEMLPSVQWYEDRKLAWGEGSAIFTSKVLGEFPKEGDPFTTIPYAWVSKCRYLELVPDDGNVQAGIDVGGGGDRTVIFERRGQVAGRVETFRDADPMRTVGRLTEKINEWDVRKVKVDSTGIGWALAGRLRELSSRHNPSGVKTGQTTHSAEVIPINAGAGPSARLVRQRLNKRAELWWDVGREHSRLGLWDLTQVSDDVVAELCEPRYEIMDSGGKIKIESKDQVIKRLGRSPDLADALLLAFLDVRVEAQTSGGLSDLTARNLLNGLKPI